MQVEDMPSNNNLVHVHMGYSYHKSTVLPGDYWFHSFVGQKFNTQLMIRSFN